MTAQEYKSHISHVSVESGRQGGQGVSEILGTGESPFCGVRNSIDIYRRGITFIGEGDYIIRDEDGTKHVCGEDKIWTRYERESAT